MVKVEMPRASWELLISALEIIQGKGYEVEYLITEISNQVYSQEY